MALHERGLDRHVKLEITQSMIEINSSVHADCVSLGDELRSLCGQLADAARTHDTRICGGGTHPFHRWQERRISPTGRFHEVAHRYGYLAKQFTAFGQHIHVGCPDGDAAIRNIQVLHRFVPHFIALGAASPFHRGVDTGFESCRLNIVAAFPLSGRMPALDSWAAFDIPPWLDDFVYRLNRFQAARFGLDGQVIVSGDGERRAIHEDVRATLEHLAAHVVGPNCAAALRRLARRATAADNGAAWLRRAYAECDDLRKVVARACDRFDQGCAPAPPVAAEG